MLKHNYHKEGKNRKAKTSRTLVITQNYPNETKCFTQNSNVHLHQISCLMITFLHFSKLYKLYICIWCVLFNAYTKIYVPTLKPTVNLQSNHLLLLLICMYS